MNLLGGFPGDDRPADHGVLVDTHQAAGLTYPAALREVLQDRQRLVWGEFAAVQGGSPAFPEAELTGAAGRDAAILVGSVAETDPQIVEAALAVVGARRVLTADVFQVVHAASHPPKPAKNGRPTAAIAVENGVWRGKPHRTRPDIPARPNTEPDFAKTECVEVPKN